MPEMPKPRRQLKIEPNADEMLAQLVRSLNRIADGVESIVETLDSVTEVGSADKGIAVRTVSK